MKRLVFKDSSIHCPHSISCHMKRLPSVSFCMSRTSAERPAPVTVTKPDPSNASRAIRPCPRSCTDNGNVTGELQGHESAGHQHFAGTLVIGTFVHDVVG